MPMSTEILALTIFLFTYCFLAFEQFPLLKLDRAGGVLIGAVLMVATGVLTFEQAWQAIDGQTIVLLTGMMLMNVYLEESGFFGWIAHRVLLHADSPIRLLVGLAFLSGTLSALFLNDTVCLMLTVPLVGVLKRARLPITPYLMTLAMSANVGSVMTITGNPQNMLIHVYSDYPYLPFLSRMAPVGMLGLVLMTLILLAFYGKRLRAGARANETQAESKPAVEPKAETAVVDRGLLTLTMFVLAGVLVGFALTPNLALVAITGAAVLLLTARRPAQDIMAKVDWVLLVFFAALFVVMEGVGKTGLLKQLSDYMEPIYGNSLSTQVPVFSTLTVLACNIVSNVPFVILARDMMPGLMDPPLMWLMLSMAATFAGNLTTPGSVATLIVLRLARSEGGITFFEFLKVGIPVTLITTAAGALLLMALGAPPL